MINVLNGSCAIIGFGYRHIEGLQNRVAPLRLIVEASLAAIRQAKIDRRQIGAIYTIRPPVADLHPQYNNKIANELKILPRLSSEITIHGSGLLSTLQYATMALQAGLADYVLCVAGDSSNIWMAGNDRISSNAFTEADLQFEAPYLPITPSFYAFIAQRHTEEYGTTPRQLAKVAVEHRKWAIRHPYACMRDKGEITIEDVLNSRMIASPLHLLDSCPRFPFGSAGAVVVCRAEDAKRHTDRPVFILGAAECTTHEYITDRLELPEEHSQGLGRSLTTTGVKIAAKHAFEAAGLGPKDVDLVGCAAQFTILPIIELEDMGFCKKGEGGKFIEDGGINFGTGLPVNTNGGLLSFGQAGASMNMDTLIEVVTQLRHEPFGERVPKARFGVVHGNGGPGMACNAVAVLGTELGGRGI